MYSVCVSVCVFVQPEISGMGGRIAMLLTPSWRVSPGELYKLLFKPIQHAVREKKPLEVFSQLRAESRARTVTFPVTLDRINLAHYNKAFGTFSKGVCWRTRPPHHGYHSCYCFLREWAILYYDNFFAHFIFGNFASSRVGRKKRSQWLNLFDCGL